MLPISQRPLHFPCSAKKLWEAWPEPVAPSGQRGILYHRISRSVDTRLREFSQRRGWLQFGDGFGICQWVVSNWDVDHLFFLGFISLLFLIAFLSLSLITIFIIFYFVAVVVLLFSQPMSFTFFPLILPLPPPGWGGGRLVAGGAWLLPGVKPQHLIISPELKRLPNSNIPLEDTKPFWWLIWQIQPYCQLILSQNTKLWKIKAKGNRV